MIEDKKRKTRRVSKKVKKMHEEAVSKGILGATSPEAKKGGGITKHDVNYTYGIIDGNEIRSRKTVRPSQFNIEDLVTLAEKGDILIKADIEDLDDPFGVQINDLFIKSAFARTNKTAIYYKFKKTTKKYDL
jgi:hypothetical protein